MISQLEISLFKEHSDENNLIAKILLDQVVPFVAEPFIDVGAGFGDIAEKAFPKSKALLLDILEFDSKNTEYGKHRRITKNFFDVSIEDIGNTGGTLFFIHSLQFLDNSPALLREKIQYLSPKYICFVVNSNDEEMGALVKHFLMSYQNVNPEVFNSEFLPSCYAAIKAINFTSLFSGTSFHELAVNVEYLMDCKIDDTQRLNLIDFLQSSIKSPMLRINQQVLLYEKNDAKAQH